MNETQAKIAGAFVAALLLNLGVDLVTDRKDVDQPTFEQLAERQHDDALANCERDNDQNAKVRETLIDLMPSGNRRDSAVARFADTDCEAVIGND